LRRALEQHVELDDDRTRIDVDAVHRYLSTESYWAHGKSREDVARGIRDAARVVGAYDGSRLIGFARVLADGVQAARLCDVYVMAEYRGRGFGVELVREAVDNGPHARLAWTLATKDAQALYRRFGFSLSRGEVMRRDRAH
jgi:GNAT superfamily N-acetyltransferase